MAWIKLVTFVTKVQKATNHLQRNNEIVQETCKEYLEQLDGELTTSNMEYKAVERIDDQLKEIKKDLERVLGKAFDKVVIEFIGATSSGKSTVINALLKEERLPTGFAETTMCLIKIYTTDEEHWSVKVNETILSNIKDLNDIKKLLDALSKDDLKEEREKLGIDECSVVHVYWPKKFSKVLPENVVLVDTPGFGEDDKCNQVIRDSCEKADIIVAVMDSMSPSKAHVTKLVKEVNCQYAFGVFTKWDELTEKQKKENSAISLDNLRKRNTTKYLDSVNSEDHTCTTDDIFFVDSLHVLRNPETEDSSLGVREFQRFEKQLAEISKKMKGELLKREVKAVAEKAEDVYVNLMEIVKKGKERKRDRLKKTLDFLEDGDKRLKTIYQNFDKSIDNVKEDNYINDIIKQFEKEITAGNSSEEDALVNFCDTVNEKIKETISSKMTSVNKKLKEWNDDMANGFPCSQSELSTTDQSEILKLECKELPDDRYNRLLDPHFYYTNNYIMGAAATAAVGALFGVGLVVATGVETAVVAGIGGTSLGISGAPLTWITKNRFGLGGIGDAIKKLEPISETKMKCWKEYLAKECRKIVEDNKKLMKKTVDRITKGKLCEVDRAKSETQKKKNELDMESHHLNKWFNELDSRRIKVQNIHRNIDHLF